MFEQLHSFYIEFLDFTKSNPVAAGVVSLYGLGCITFFIKIVPLKVWKFIKRQCTTTLALNSCDNIYHEFLEWVSENNMNSLVRNLNFNNKGVWSQGIPMINIGYGKTMFFFNKHLFVMYRNKDEANQTAYVKESITIVVVGRNHKVFSDLFEIIKEKETKEKTLKVHLYTKDGWSASKHQTRRRIDTVIIEKHKKDKILNSVDDFISKKEWYINNGIPYNLGILFYGPSGTGKTSLIKAIASHYDKHLYVLSLTNMSDALLETALSNIPYGSIVAIEDIDTAKLGKRDLNHKDKQTNEESLEKLICGLSLGGVLNALDGITSAEGRILIATTNNIDVLDDALIREGRFDVKTHIGYMTDDTMREYLSRFYDDDFSQCKVKNNIPPCKVQRLVFENRNDSSKVLKEICL